MAFRCARLGGSLARLWRQKVGRPSSPQGSGASASPTRSSRVFWRCLTLIILLGLTAVCLRCLTPGGPVTAQAMSPAAGAATPRIFLPAVLDSGGSTPGPAATPTPTTTPAVVITPPPCDGPLDLTLVAPASGDPGSEVTLYGCGFGTDKSQVQVYFIQTLYWGPAMNAEVVSCSDTRIVVKAPRPTGEPSWDINLPTTVFANVGGSPTDELPFEITNIVPDPPQIVALGRFCAKPGESLYIDAVGLAPTAEQNIVSFDDVEAVADTCVSGGEAGQVHRGHITVTVPLGITSDSVQLKRLDGIDAWSEPYPLEVRPRATLTLTAGLEAQGLPDMGSWLLGGSGFSQVHNYSPGTVPGLVFLDVTTPVQTVTLSGYAVSDTQLAVPYVLPEFYQGLKDGDIVSIRARGWDCSETVYSNVLTLSYKKLTPGTTVDLSANVTLAAGQTHVALSKGDYLCVRAEHSVDPQGETQNLRAPGLWEGTLPFFEIGQVPFHRPRLHSKCFPARTAGTYTIYNDTSGQSLPYEVRHEGVYEETGLVGTWEVGHLLDPAAGATVGFGGGRLIIPPGALPSSSETYYVEAAHLPSDAVPYDGVQADGGHQFSIKFTPEPAALLKPITIVLPYSPVDRFGTFRFGLFDKRVNVYLEIDGVVDPVNQTLTVELPAQDYGAAGLVTATAAGDPPEMHAAGFLDDVGDTINTVLHQMTVVAGICATCTLTDSNDHFLVDYVCDDRNESYVTAAYAQQVLDMLVATRGKMVGAGWQAPPRLTVSIRSLALADGGSTTKGVFGTPWIYIHSKMPMGAELKTVTAHELGHAFQRLYTTNIVTQWIDEAAANWVSFFALGSEATLQGALFSGGEFASVGIPAGLTWGYNMEQGYAAVAFVSWMAKQYGDSSILNMYNLLSRMSLYWNDSYGTFSSATGASMAEIMKLFGRDYWTQSYPPVDKTGFPQGPPWTQRSYQGWDGVLIGDARPAMSAHGYAVGRGTAPQPPDIATRPGIVRATAIGSDQVIYVYGDTAWSYQSIGTLTPLGVLDASTRYLQLAQYGQYPTYRLIVVNATTAAATPNVHVVALALDRLSNTSGSGGTTVILYGSGFGATPGEVTVGGLELYQNGFVDSWSDKWISVRMPPLSPGVANVQVQTAEGIWVPDILQFTYVND